jgi:hypothetical protein
MVTGSAMYTVGLVVYHVGEKLRDQAQQREAEEQWAREWSEIRGRVEPDTGHAPK